jgi:septal ring factor EnvC (AmiA/AmiB activator)
MGSLIMSEYNFEFKSLDDRIRYLEAEVERLKQELIETDNTLYEIMNRLDSMDQSEYTFKNSLGEL